MNEENTIKLKAGFPKMFRTVERDPSPFQYWGFECGDGWFDLVYKLCQEIELIARNAGLESTGRSWPYAVQVKEKFGGLRFYINLAGMNETVVETIRQLIAQVEKESFTTCEKCGAPGQVYSQGWIHTLCKRCERNYQTRRNDNT